MSKNKVLVIIIAVIVILIAGLFLVFNSENWLKGKNIKIENNGENKAVENNAENNNENEEEPEEAKNASPISGIKCDNSQRRPFAVMLAGDLEAWPLSGIIEADLVIEMPVVTDGITRYMAVYVCNNPKEIGSIRSARHNFIPLAMGFDAIFAHWGGSYFALDKLDNKIMDNINALYLDGSVFYRKSGLPKPHDGFTTIERLEDYSKRIGYRLTNEFAKYQFYEEENPSSKDGEITIEYPSIYKVSYKYDAKINSYLRFKGDKKDGNKKDIDKKGGDKLIGQQISAKNVVIMYADSKQIEGQYNDVDVEGGGDAIVYQNGWEIKGKWKKDKGDLKSKLYFYNESGEEIKFVPGQIWIQIVQPNQNVEWKLDGN